MSAAHTAESNSAGLGDLLARRVAEFPDALAVRDRAAGVELSYRRLWERAGRVAAGLLSRGVGRGELVGVDLPRSPDLVVALVGVVRAGAAYLALDRLSPPDRLAGVVRDAGARWVLGDGPDVGASRIGMSEVDSPGAADVPAGGDDPVYACYTSGSTGRPKGVLVPHRAVVRLAVNPRFCAIDRHDRVALMANPAFDATTFEVWNTLVAGAALVVVPGAAEVAVPDWVATLREEGVTTAFLTTSLFHAVARERPSAFRDLRTLVVGGEQMDLATTRSVLAAGPPGRLVNGYGPTETTTFATYFDCDPRSLADVDQVPIGFPLQATAVRVVDDGLRDVPAGQVGELLVGGPGVALGYVGLPGLTAERFVRGPHGVEYRTGDLVREIAGGALEMVGRRDRQVKVRGFRIELEEVERAVLATGLVDAAFVEKVGDGPAAALVAFVLPGPADRAADPAVLRTRLTPVLPSYMVPSRWVVLDSVPLGLTGKADRTRLLSLLDEHDSPEAADGTADAVSAIWRDVLGVASVSGSDNFLERGGNSILAVQVAARVHDRLDVPLEPGDVLLADSLTDLVAHVRRRESR
ncbi:amino acid adenylation domain-containing protein [Actinosynnema sp. NPDC053489]|uniref:amino acid adenylation domain-containing protein n=1 Tax=Actinosynnema sp. NPDC053489 TaxID=3363916 RepID=UPI0037C5654C